MDSVCPSCGEAAIEFEEVEGISACGACGWVLAADGLVHGATFDEEGPVGVYVGASDTGERAAAYALQASGTGLAIQRSRQGGGEKKLQARVREFGALLHLPPSVLDQALHVLEQAVPHCMGSWRRDHLAAAATYAACRLNKLPLTLADLAATTQMEAHTLGHYYTALSRLLNLQPPLLLPQDLLPRSVDRVTAEAVRQGRLAAPKVPALQRDAALLLDWMHQHLERRRFPMASVGAALVLAAEMNTVSLSLEHVCASLPLARSTLDVKLAQVRQRLVQLAAFLPYSSTITTRNVGSHARTIVRLSALVGSAAPAAGAPAGTNAAAAPAGNTASGQQPLAATGQQASEQRDAGQTEQQDGSQGAAALAAQEGCPPAAQQELEDAEDERYQQRKRARIERPSPPGQLLPDGAAVLGQKEAGVSSTHGEGQQQQQQQQQPTEPG